MVADPTRLQLLSLIIGSPNGEALVGELAAELGVTQPTVSHHVKVMTEAGLLRRDRRGRLRSGTRSCRRAGEVVERVRDDAADGMRARTRHRLMLPEAASDLPHRFEGCHPRFPTIDDGAVHRHVLAGDDRPLCR